MKYDIEFINIKPTEPSSVHGGMYISMEVNGVIPKTPDDLITPRRGRIFIKSPNPTYGGIDTPTRHIYSIYDEVIIMKRFHYYTSIGEITSLVMEHNSTNEPSLTIFVLEDPQICFLSHTDFNEIGEILLIHEDEIKEYRHLVTGYDTLVENDGFIAYKFSNELKDILTLCGVIFSTPTAIPTYGRSTDEIAVMINYLVDNDPMFHYNMDNN